MLDARINRFMAVAECGSFSKAEQSLDISKQALSKHITSLENDLGFPLFTRTHRGLQLTEAGKVFYDGVKKLEPLVESVLNSCESVLDQRPSIRIGRLSHHMILERVNKEYERRYPHVELIPVLSSEISPIRRVSSRINDVAETARPTSEEPDYPGYTPLLTLPYSCVMSKSHPLSAEASITVRSLSRYSVAICKAQWTAYDLNAIQESIPDLSEINYTEKPIEQTYALCEKGCVVITPAYYAYFLSNLRRIPLDAPYEREYGICYLPNPRASVQKYIETAIAVYKNAPDVF